MDHLDELEHRSVHILREAYASYAPKVIRDPALLDLRDVFEEWVEFAIG